MFATAIIGTVLFTYAGWMVLKSIKSVKGALKGEGCTSCDASCQDCKVVTEIKLNT